MRTCIVALLVGATAVTVAAEISLECYSCAGYDPAAEVDQYLNNKDCALGAFHSTGVSKRTLTTSIANEQLYCYTSLFYSPPFNNGNVMTYRGVLNYTGRGFTKLGINEKSEGYSDTTWCQTANCNGRGHLIGAEPIVFLLPLMLLCYFVMSK